MYSVEEANPVMAPIGTKKTKPSDFAGTLSKKDAAALLNYVEESRKEYLIDSN